MKKNMERSYILLKEDRARKFNIRALDALSRYKTEKRKDYETRAAKVMTDVYKKKCFRDHLQKSIKGRQKVISVINNYALVMRLRKYMICYF
jgi:hypothetical protein